MFFSGYVDGLGYDYGNVTVVSCVCSMNNLSQSVSSEAVSPHSRCLFTKNPLECVQFWRVQDIAKSNHVHLGRRGTMLVNLHVTHGCEPAPGGIISGVGVGFGDLAGLGLTT